MKNVDVLINKMASWLTEITVSIVYNYSDDHWYLQIYARTQKAFQFSRYMLLVPSITDAIKTQKQ